MHRDACQSWRKGEWIAGVIRSGQMPKPDPKTPPDEDRDRELDEALEETFPASDPISPMEPEERRAPKPKA
jgi:hypothetical protein